MSVRITPFNTYLTDIKPEIGVQDVNAGHVNKERRKMVYDRRQRDSDRRRPNVDRLQADEKTLAPILQELRNSFFFLNEDEQTGGTGEA